MGKWTAFPHLGEYQFDAASLQQHWPRLHAGDAEPLPADPRVLEAWVLFHNGEFQRAAQAGLVLAELRGLASDGAPGLESYRRQALAWVSHQRCVFHLWRGLAGTLGRAVAAAVEATVKTAGASGQRPAAQGARRTLIALVRAVYEAESMLAAQLALARLAAEPYAQELAREVAAHVNAALVHRCGYNQGLGRASPEWLWRDFRLRLSHGRNHGTEQRLERAALLWAIYQNFEPAQERSERKRHYRHPGHAPLATAGLAPGAISYLDALAV